MKFGKNIGQQQQDDSFGLHYVDYKLLKKKVKAVAEHLSAKELSEALSANTYFEEALALEIREVNASFEQRIQDLLAKIAGLSEQLQTVSMVSNERSSSSSSTSKHEDLADMPESWQGLFQSLVGLLQEVDVLRKYAVWNAVGVVKILKKRRKQTSFGLEDVGAERAGWLSRQSFFSGSDFAQLHAAIESFGTELVKIFADFVPSMSRSNPLEEPSQCPICLDTITDKIELPCQHRFCWKCFVLGPIAYQPADEYRITHCPICRCEAVKPTDTKMVTPPQGEEEEFGAESMVGLVPSSQGVLTRFLHTYFPKGIASEVERHGGDGDDEGAGRNDEDMRDVVANLMRVVLEKNEKPSKSEGSPTGHQQDAAGLASASGAASSSAGPSVPSDFFDTLPPKQPQQQLRDAQKVQWLQLAMRSDPMELDSTMCCSLCSEPLCMEAVVTTPCKHHFHKVCISRIEMPQCPLCSSSLPFNWFLPGSHPLAETGFRCVPVCKYRPHFPGGPGRGNNGYPLHAPPPASLYSANGMVKSYLHKIPPMGDGTEEDEPHESPSAHATPSLMAQASPSGAPAGEDLPTAGASDSESSSDESHSGDEEGGDADDSDVEDAAKDLAPRKSAKTAQTVWAYTSLGKMRMCTGNCNSSSSNMLDERRSADLRIANPQVLLIGNHL
mmetsp:Transcript_75568/g.179554  ORF Transcript_75568/g.179554 Transcript_75568/m.179554 type:complete len:669 (+) Transcript_75568:52-2058(+)